MSDLLHEVQQRLSFYNVFPMSTVRICDFFLMGKRVTTMIAWHLQSEPCSKLYSDLDIRFKAMYPIVTYC